MDAASTPLTVALTGSSGLVGSALRTRLRSEGHRVVRLVRSPVASDDERHWSPLEPDPHLLDGIDALVHLAGAPIGQRFTARHKAAVRDSRIEPTRRLAELVAQMADGPTVLVSASAIGLYGADRGDEVLSESSPRGDGFLADLVAAWEGATAPAAHAGRRVTLIRTGIVQAAHGGTLGLMRPLFRFGLGGRLGRGRQWVSWIDLDDLCAVYDAALTDPRFSGPINAVAPEPVRNTEYTATLAGVLKRPAMFPVPKFALAAVLGSEGATELALASQRVEPAQLEQLNFPFGFRTLEASLRHQLTVR